MHQIVFFLVPFDVIELSVKNWGCRSRGSGGTLFHLWRWRITQYSDALDEMESTEARTGHPGDHMYCYLTKEARANTEGAKNLVCDVVARFMNPFIFILQLLELNTDLVQIQCTIGSPRASNRGQEVLLLPL
jgi:hypothetical protein